MKKKHWFIALPFLLVLGAILSGILFPRFWLRVIKPVEFEIKQVNMSIDPENIDLDFKILLTRHYIIDFSLDSLGYDIYFDSLNFSNGGALIKNQLADGESDTIRLPLVIDRSAFKESRSGGEMVDLRIVLHTYLDLPVAGKVKFDSEITRRIHSPQPPEFSVVNVELEINDLNDAHVAIDFKLANPNNYTFDIVKIEANLDFEDLFTAVAHTPDTIHVPANDAVIFGAFVDINDLELIRDGLRIVFRPNKAWPYTIHAKLYIDQKDEEPMILKITHTGTMEIMSRRKAFNKGE